ncbi:MAG TPA: dihydrofolate reductase, partial [Chitinophagaceae bacterium]|nr:dihydrofolate reductase [Chitinophagaceae bacterium]
MIISHIVAAGENNEIGKQNQLLWKLPNDMKFFKNTTWGMPVIMGRKTYESIAGEPLPGRINIIITSNRNYDPKSDKAVVVTDFDKAIEKAKETDCKEAFVAGGGEIYALTLPKAHRIYLTRVHHEFPDAEVFYPEIRDGGWKKVSSLEFKADERHAFDYSFEVWEKEG